MYMYKMSVNKTSIQKYLYSLYCQKTAVACGKSQCRAPVWYYSGTAKKTKLNNNKKSADL